ncbi:type II toxin-antitoxin system HicA family toxin [Candidatus Gottesmanbacteria bacterium]|nr:type II toxin-antitoxin system HicA family toxin [Candidatus Gottesmanbacteria bacterium]
MGKLSSLSAREVERALKRAGFVFVSQKGSHKKFRRTRSDGRVETVILPDHKHIKEGTLRKGILRPINMSAEEFLTYLRD